MEFTAWLADAVSAGWQALDHVPFGKSVLKAALLAGGIFGCIRTVEWLTRTSSPNYRSRGFAIDMFYWFYYRAGFHTLLVFAPIAVLLNEPLSLISTGWLTPLPYPAHLAIIFVTSDFFAYWIHRAEHRFKFMWAFHTTHHSQTHLNFATIARFHPVEMLYHNILVFIPLKILGLDPTAWLPMFLLNQLLGGWVHTQIPWKLGRFYKVIATPTFHSFHHSTDAAHHDKNFSSVFSLWDYMFGTAHTVEEARPTRFGLEGIPSSLLGTLVTPFKLLHRYYAPRRAAVDGPAPAASSEA